MISSVVGLGLNQILKFSSSSDLGMPWIFAIGQTWDCPAFLSGSAPLWKNHTKMTFGRLPLRWTGVFWSIRPTFKQIFLINWDTACRQAAHSRLGNGLVESEKGWMPKDGNHHLLQLPYHHNHHVWSCGIMMIIFMMMMMMMHQFHRHHNHHLYWHIHQIRPMSHAHSPKAPKNALAY